MAFFQHTQSIQRLNVVSQSIASGIGLDLQVPIIMVTAITNNQVKASGLSDGYICNIVYCIWYWKFGMVF